MTEDHSCEPMLAPRVLGVAEKAWSQRERTMDAGQLRACAAAWEKIFKRIDWKIGKPAAKSPAVDIG